MIRCYVSLHGMTTFKLYLFRHSIQNFCKVALGSKLPFAVTCSMVLFKSFVAFNYSYKRYHVGGTYDVHISNDGFRASDIDAND